MSSNTNNLRDIIAQACTDAIAPLLPPGEYPLDTAIIDNAVAKTLALLPPLEEITEADKQDANWTDRAVKGARNNTIRETRRNLIGEQPGSSQSAVDASAQGHEAITDNEEAR